MQRKSLGLGFLLEIFGVVSIPLATIENGVTALCAGKDSALFKSMCLVSNFGIEWLKRWEVPFAFSKNCFFFCM
jgi:hypothetical protein